MIPSPTTTKRLLIPRWRSFADTTAAGELSANKSQKTLDVSSPNLAEFERRKEEWHKFPTEITAAELVETAIILGLEDAASGAAVFLANADTNVTTLVRRQSQQLLSRLNQCAEEEPLQIPTIREQLRQSPDDAILWVELSLRQIVSGATESAVRSMKAALKLAPDNRHVLRSAARLFSHLREPDVGYYLLRKSTATESDPWLMSAEIAMAGRVDKKPAYLRKGLLLLEATTNPRLDFSELAGAAATTFLEGSIPKRQAKKLFLQSLEAPTDNAIAQAEWASQFAGERFVDADKLPKFSRAKEAHALHLYSVGNYSEALAASQEWIAEERFSGRAYAFAASVANTMDDYKTAILICHQGIRHDPKSATLRNSLIFALISDDRLSDAEQAMLDVRLGIPDAFSELVGTANQGLMAFKRREFEKGEALYRNAINGFKRKGSEYLAISAHAYFAREAKRSGHPRSSEIVKEAMAAVGGKKHRIAERILKQLDPPIQL
jgi:tetratricopeptide (TPR) repeat protein